MSLGRAIWLASHMMSSGILEACHFINHIYNSIYEHSYTHSNLRTSKNKYPDAVNAHRLLKLLSVHMHIVHACMRRSKDFLWKRWALEENEGWERTQQRLAIVQWRRQPIGRGAILAWMHKQYQRCTTLILQCSCEQLHAARELYFEATITTVTRKTALERDAGTVCSNQVEVKHALSSKHVLSRRVALHKRKHNMCWHMLMLQARYHNTALSKMRCVCTVVNSLIPLAFTW